jgi:branched-chain amino acid transport system substrate-binding protein
MRDPHQVRIRTLTTASMAAMLLAGCAAGATPSPSASTSSSGSSAPSPKGDYLIGYSAALSGWLAPYDTEYLKGVQLAIDEINGAGGAGGYTLKLETKDNQSDAPTSGVVATNLVSDGAKALFCTADADPGIPCALVGKDHGLPTFSFASAPSLVLAVPTAFITYSPDNLVAAADAEFALAQGWKSAYLLGSNDIAYTKLIPEYFQEAYEKGGGKVIGSATYTLSQAEFGAVVTRIQSASPAPDVIFTPAFPPDSTTFIRALRAAGVTTPVLSTDGNDTPLFLQGVGSAGNNVWYSAQGYAKPGDTSTPLGKFYEKFKAATGAYPDSTFPALGYDTIQILAAALTKAGTADSAAVISALESLPPIDGAAGKLGFTATEHLPVKDITIVKVVDGQLQPVTVLTPTYVPAPR